MFEKINSLIGSHVLHIKKPFISRIISDSTGLYIHILVLSQLSLIIALLWSFVKGRKPQPVLFDIFMVIISYYLAYHMLVYGCNKLFKWQFYLPEPNTLFTTVGNTYRDLLYWSTMGTSHSYNVFLGSTEIIAGLLLFFRRTRLAGALLTTGIMINIVMINVSFDISVKVFSIFLLLLSILIIMPDGRQLFRFFFSGQTVVKRSGTSFYITGKWKKFYLPAKCIAITWLLVSALWVYLRSGNFNDDLAARPPFHGAYNVSNNNAVDSGSSQSKSWKRLFVHRKGYLIIQYADESMQDYPLIIDTIGKKWIVTDLSAKREYVWRYQSDSNQVHIWGNNGRGEMNIRLQKINLDSLPLMKKEFSWTIDQ